MTNRKLVGIKKIEPFSVYDITVENDQCFELENGITAHNSMYSQKIVSGGQGVTLSANQVFIITKSQEKKDGEIAGWKFTIGIEKSRYVKEKAKIPFTVLYSGGIQKWSLLFDLAQESGHIVKPKNGWYAYVDQKTGEVLTPNKREAAVKEDDEFFENLIKDESFQEFVKKKYQLQGDEISQTEGEKQIPPLDEDDIDISK